MPRARSETLGSGTKPKERPAFTAPEVPLSAADALRAARTAQVAHATRPKEERRERIVWTSLALALIGLLLLFLILLSRWADAVERAPVVNSTPIAVASLVDGAQQPTPLAATSVEVHGTPLGNGDAAEPGSAGRSERCYSIATVSLQGDLALPARGKLCVVTP